MFNCPVNDANLGLQYSGQCTECCPDRAEGRHLLKTTAQGVMQQYFTSRSSSVLISQWWKQSPWSAVAGRKDENALDREVMLCGVTRSSQLFPQGTESRATVQPVTTANSPQQWNIYVLSHGSVMLDWQQSLQRRFICRWYSKDWTEIIWSFFLKESM